jgi:NTP pyrophosphatase (non-canonical NTP hydrolase)
MSSYDEKKTEQWKRALRLNSIQREAKVWLGRNFPDTTADQQFLGVVEEVGELAHAILKKKQGIRDTSAESAKDAVADIMIFLMNYCNMMDWDLMEIVQDVWVDEVCPRDWQKYPENGIDK